MKRHFSFGLAALCVAAVATSFAAKPRIADLTVNENGNRIVKITYKLQDAPGVVTIDILTNSLADATGSWVSIGGENVMSSLTGVVGKLLPESDEMRTIVWRPRQAWPGHMFKNGTAKVVLTAWAEDEPPTFMVVDLTNEVSRFTYYADKSFLPGGIGDRAYKTNKMLFRRIPAAGVTWKMGSPADEAQRTEAEDLHDVTLTEDYYLAVYPTTERQNAIVRIYHDAHKAECGGGNWLWYWAEKGNYDGSGYDAETIEVCPYPVALYFNLRGKNDSLYNWPDNGHDVNPNGFFGTLRVMTGGEMLFDLPTEAQWEFAARGGTAGQTYYGKSYNYTWGLNTDNLDANIWWWGNSTLENGTRFPHPVGTKTANALDLYDMMGNVSESCLDQYVKSLGTEPATNPKGPATGAENPSRVYRSGCCCSEEHYARYVHRSAFREGVTQVDNHFWGIRRFGFRVWAPAKAIAR